MLVKALPHVGEEHGETVCCAGVTKDLKWRRQFPVTFRYLEDQKFKRWQWIKYAWREPKNDKREESQRVQEGSIEPGEVMPLKERSNFLQSLIIGSTTEAYQKGNTLALVRPIEPKFRYFKKDNKQLEKEREAYAGATRQLSFFNQTQNPLNPCPYEFRFEYRTEDGPHDHKCGDWETAAMYFNFSKKYGEQEALQKMDETFNRIYPTRGMTFAMGTHSLYPKLWLLVGVLRLNKLKQLNLL